MIKYALYCSLCWQEFDHPSEHDKASMQAGNRLNGHCRGDIRLMLEKGKLRNFAPKPTQPGLIPDTDEPLFIK